MSIQLDQPLTQELRTTLENLAAGLFGLDAWIRGANKYKPPDPNLPWRDPAHTLAPKDMGVMQFFEALLRESSGDDDLSARWEAVTDDPLRFSPLADARAWRLQRGLSEVPKFGILASSNVLLIDLSGNPISRSTFYAPCWPVLKGAVGLRNPQTATDWFNLATELLNDQNPLWPNTKQPLSSAFIIQFTSDMLYAMLGMRNDVPEPWRYALLIELGEYRRVGNCYTPDDTKAAVAAFENQVGI